jgi:hypothetical protein
MPLTAGTRNFSAVARSCGLTNTAWKVSRSEAKPLSGGRARTATAPPKKASEVCDMRQISPPSLSM